MKKRTIFAASFLTCFLLIGCNSEKRQQRINERQAKKAEALLKKQMKEFKDISADIPRDSLVNFCYDNFPITVTRTDTFYTQQRDTITKLIPVFSDSTKTVVTYVELPVETITEFKTKVIYLEDSLKISKLELLNKELKQFFESKEANDKKIYTFTIDSLQKIQLEKDNIIKKNNRFSILFGFILVLSLLIISTLGLVKMYSAVSEFTKK